ncbi:MAG: C-GCAxxG-C-C family protein [Candidatus Nezhaarchaeales archaeon]
MSISELIEKIGRAAYYYEKIYHGCSQCVLKALQEHLQLGDGESFKAASAFAGGVARMGEVCGALSGGIMAIGLAYGREKLEDARFSPRYAKAMELAVDLYQRFEKEFGSVKCRDIQTFLFGRAFDLKNPVEYEEFVRAGAYEKCPEVVKKAAQLAAELILKSREVKQ